MVAPTPVLGARDDIRHGMRFDRRVICHQLQQVVELEPGVRASGHQPAPALEQPQMAANTSEVGVLCAVIVLVVCGFFRAPAVAYAAL